MKTNETLADYAISELCTRQCSCSSATFCRTTSSGFVELRWSLHHPWLQPGGAVAISFTDMMKIRRKLLLQFTNASSSTEPKTHPMVNNFAARDEPARPRDSLRSFGSS
uniref:Uncharacterized protein n=1 Tax=Macrostomum lignano TaxID=282301 RepID=A0A1I8FJA5_9PLAT